MKTGKQGRKKIRGTHNDEGEWKKRKTHRKKKKERENQRKR